MPAASEPGPGPQPQLAPTLPHTWRPLGPRLVGTVLGVGLIVVYAAAWFSFDQEVRDDFTGFQIGTVFALTGLGLFCVYALVRSRATATREGLLVVNGYRRRQLAWEQIVEVRLSPGAPWVVLDLADGTTCNVMAIQGSDGSHARTCARQLRALVMELPR
ncbi:MAG: PH domain-containing protein [Nocardioides sp.]